MEKMYGMTGRSAIRALRPTSLSFHRIVRHSFNRFFETSHSVHGIFIAGYCARAMSPSAIMNNRVMRLKITLVTTTVVLALMAGISPRVFAQTYDSIHARGVVLAGNGVDVSHTLSITVAPLSGSTSIVFPAGNASGVLTNNGLGVLSWVPLAISNIAAGAHNTFLTTNNSGVVGWNGLSVDGVTLTGDGSSTPLAIKSTYPGQASITTLGTVTTGTWNGSNIDLAHGGTNASLTASNGGIFYSTGTAGAILSGTATANQILMSGASTAPTWSTATYPATTTINQLLYSSAANGVTGLATANSGVLITSSGGVPSIASTLPSGLTIPSPNISNPTFTGTVVLPAGTITAASIGLANQNILVGNASGDAAAVVPIANSVLITDATAPIGSPKWATTLPSGLTVPSPSISSPTITGAGSIGGSTTINTSGSITGGAGSFTTLSASGNTTLDASPSTGGTVGIGNSTSTTTINGGLNITGTVTYTTTPSIPLATNNIFTGQSNIATALAPTANAVLITGGLSPFQTPQWATTLPSGLTLPSPIISNPTFSGTVVFPSGTISATSIAHGGANTFLTTANDGTTVAFTGLNVSTGLSGNGVGTALTNTGVLSLANGGGITASTTTGAITLGSTATSANTASAIVARDASGNFTAGTITAALSGNATTATTGTNIATTNQTSGTYFPAMVSSSATSASTGADVAAGLSFTASTTVPSLNVGVAGSSTGSVVLANSGNSNLTTITVPSGAPAITYTLPTVAPTSGQFLSSSTSGGLSWATPSGSGSGSGAMLTGSVQTDVSNNFFYNPATGFNNGNATAKFNNGNIATVSSSGQLKNFVVTIQNPPGAGKSWTFTVEDLTTSATGAAVTISGATATSGTDVSTVLNVNAGDSISILVTGTGNSSGGADWAIGAFGTGAAGVTSISNSGGLSFSPNPIVATGTIGLDLTHANTWTGQQTFNNTTTGTAPIITANTAATSAIQYGAAFSSTGLSTGLGNVGLLLNASGSTGYNAALYVQTGTINVQGLTPSELVMTDASRNLTSLAPVGSGTLLAGIASVPTFTSTPTLGVISSGGSPATGAISFANASSTKLTTIQAGNATAAITYTLPTAAPTTSGQVLASTTAGVLSWQSSNGTASSFGATGATYISKSNSDFSTTSVTAVPVPGLSFAVAAGEVWSFRMEVAEGSGNTATGFYTGLSTPSGSTFSGEAEGLADLGANGHERFQRFTSATHIGDTIPTNWTGQLVGSFNNVANDDTSSALLIFGTVDNTNGTAGTVQLLFAATGGVTQTVHANSFCTAWKYAYVPFDQIYTSSSTLVIPAGITKIYVNGAGGSGGGGGGGAKTANGTFGAGGGGGGGAGGYVPPTIIPVVAGETLTITVGAAGTLGAGGIKTGTASTSGGNGGTTSIVGSSSGTIFSAAGGVGGTFGANAGSVNTSGGAAGSGAAAPTIPSSGTAGNSGTAGATGSAAITGSAAGGNGTGTSNIGGNGGTGFGANGNTTGNGGNGTAGTKGYVEITY